MLAGKEASMDGATLFNRSARARGRCCHQGWPVAPSGCSAIWRGRQHRILWVQRFHKTGSVEPDKIGGYRPKKIAGRHREWLVKRCGRADFTIRGLVAELAERGLKVDYRTVWEFVHAEKLSYKKRR